MKRYAKEFTLSTAEQRSPQWYKERAGIPSASGLGKLLGTPAKRRDYLNQLAYERQFGTTYDTFTTQAMLDGITYEDFARQVYQRDTGNRVETATSYISDWFIATPDGLVGDKGLLECKVVGDKTFLDILENGIPLDHELQCQGQLLASGLDWVDYIAVNLKTRAYIIIRQHRNNKLIKRIYERLHEPLELPVFNREVKYFDNQLLTDYKGDKPADIGELGF